MATAQVQFRAQSLFQGQLVTQPIQFHQDQGSSPQVPVATMVTKTETQYPDYLEAASAQGLLAHLTDKVSGGR